MSQLALPNLWFGTRDRAVLPVHRGLDDAGSAPASYHRYQFAFDKLNDYPKFGVWPDAYYMTINQFTSGTLQWAGQGVIAIDRARMLAGQPASIRALRSVVHRSESRGDAARRSGRAGSARRARRGTSCRWTTTRGATLRTNCSSGGFTWTGRTRPRPSFYRSSAPGDRRVRFGPVWQRRPASGSQVPPHGCTRSPTASCTGCSTATSAPTSPSSSTRPSTPTARTMPASAGTRCAIPGGAPFIHQQGTYAPDADDRSVGSAAMDRVGNLGDRLHGLRDQHVSRRSGTPGAWPPIAPGVLTQGEADLMAGSGSQTHTSGRWGDYSALLVDPSDGCTFWYTSQYDAATSEMSWRTRIGSFAFPSCTSASGLPVVTVTATTAAVSEAGPSAGRFTFSRSGDTSASLTVRYTVDGTATADADYAALPETVTIPAGRSRRRSR